VGDERGPAKRGDATNSYSPLGQNIPLLQAHPGHCMGSTLCLRLNLRLRLCLSRGLCQGLSLRPSLSLSSPLPPGHPWQRAAACLEFVAEPGRSWAGRTLLCPPGECDSMLETVSVRRSWRSSTSTSAGRPRLGPSKPLLVLAGPGSGKVRRLVWTGLRGRQWRGD